MRVVEGGGKSKGSEMDGWMDGRWKTGRSEEGWLLDIFRLEEIVDGEF